jgi:AraC-like DNA-binding protein
MVTMLEIEKTLFLESLTNLIARLAYIRRLERMWQLIENDYADPELTLEKAAMASGVNKNHLNVLLRQTTTFTFHQLLTRYRLLKAVGMMSAKNYNLLEIALHNGFGSLNTFERNFRCLLGTTPKDFKAQSRPPRANSTLAEAMPE